MSLMPESKLFNVRVAKESHKWNILRDLWSQESFNSIRFFQGLEGWEIVECVSGLESFHMKRDVVTLRRSTEKDIFGLLGVSLLNLGDASCYITEGVSDYFTTKLCVPSKNVLGVTTLGGSVSAKKILISLFTDITIIADKDTAGLNTAFLKWKEFLNRYGIRSRVLIPEHPLSKDITDDFIRALRVSNEVCI